MKKKEKFHMAGTEGTGQYLVLAVSPAGRVGYRVLNGKVRIRLEPASETAEDEMRELFSGWKQPNEEQFRFSTVVENGPVVVEAVEKALAAIGVNAGVEFNPAAADWQQNFNGSSPEGDVPAEVAVEVAGLEAVITTAEELATRLRELRGNA